MCFVDIEKALKRSARKVLEQAMRKKVLAKSVKSIYKGAKIRVRVDSELSAEFDAKVVMHQGSVMSPFLSAVVADVVTELAKECALSELLYANDLFLLSETIKGLTNKFLKWKESFESKGVRVNIEKTKATVSSGITKDGFSKSKVDPCGVCSMRVKAN